MIPIAKPIIEREEKEAVLRVLNSGCIAQGSEVEAFEKEFASFCKAKYSIATTSGTTALQLALLSLGVGPEDEVITTPFSFIASSNSILYSGAKPIFCDIKEETFNIDPKKIESLITSKTKAILPVHLYGYPSDMKSINILAKKYNLLVIEDACQAHGATIKDQPVGSFGDTACFSFYPTKNMTTGEGGIIIFKNKKDYNKAAILRAHGMKKRYLHEILGYNFRMTDIHASIGREQLKKLPNFNKKRQKNANYLLNNIKNPKIQLPETKKNYGHVFHQFTIIIENGNRDNVVKTLTDKGVGVGIHYPICINEQPVYVEKGYKSDTPIANEISRKVISLPVHPGLSKEDLKTIAKVLNKI